MKPVDLSGEIFATGITLLALRRYRLDGAIATRFFTRCDPEIIFEIRIKSVGGKKVTRRWARKTSEALKASGSTRQRAR